MTNVRVEAKIRILLAAFLLGYEKPIGWNFVVSGSGLAASFLLSIIFFHFTKRLFPNKYLELSKIFWVGVISYALRERLGVSMISAVSLLLLLPPSFSEIHSRLYWKKGVLQAGLFLVAYLGIVSLGAAFVLSTALTKESILFFQFVFLGVLSAILSSDGFKKVRWAYV